tara:strand:+ start:489 stop:665 length:177 start_codon:yes stop_codon:yes gene_type:complete
MSCKKKYHYEITATLEEEFEDAEKAANQMNATDKAIIKKLEARLVRSSIKKKEDYEEQ